MKKVYSTTILTAKREDFLKFLDELSISQFKSVDRGEYSIYSIDLATNENYKELKSKLDKNQTLFL